MHTHMHIQSCMHTYTQQDEGHSQVYCNSYKLFLEQICGLGVVAQSCHLGTREAKTGGRDFEIRVGYLGRHYLNARPKKAREMSQKLKLHSVLVENLGSVSSTHTG